MPRGMAGSETPRARKPEAEPWPVAVGAAAERDVCARARVCVNVRDWATSPALMCVRASVRVTGPVTLAVTHLHVIISLGDEGDTAAP